MDHRKNNFDFLRLIFASFVIVTHSYVLSGAPECDFLCQISNGQVNFSYLGVKGFFVISGYLIFQSLLRSGNIIDYYWKRLLRLFPALFVVLVLTVILVPFVYESTVPLFQNKSWLTYVPNNMSLYLTQFKIEGVFENNPFKSAVNGSLWTIPYEFTMYVLLSFLIVCRKQKIITLIALAVAFLLLWIGNVFYFEQLSKYEYILMGGPLVDLGAFFMGGAFLAAVNIERMHRKKEVLIVVSVLVLASLFLGFYNDTRFVTLPVLFVLFGLNPIRHIDSIGNRIGDLSYGIYIYGFPVQQTLMYYFRLNFIALMICSLVISYILAYMSWHLVEKGALRLKKYTHPRFRATQNVVS